MNGAEPHVAGSGAVVSSRFEMIKERQDALRCEGGELKAAWIAGAACCVQQQELQAIAIALLGVGAKGSLVRQVREEEILKGAGQSSLHSTPPFLKSCSQAAWKRWEEARRSSGVS